jgi:K+-transporting ATPase ATPase C chain
LWCNTRKDAVARWTKKLKAADLDTAAPIPVDLVATSGSELDPHISPAAAAY